MHTSEVKEQADAFTSENNFLRRIEGNVQGNACSLRRQGFPDGGLVEVPQRRAAGPAKQGADVIFPKVIARVSGFQITVVVLFASK